MLDPRREARRAAGDEGENLAFDRQDLVRVRLAAVFLDRRIFDVADRADGRDDRVAVRLDLGGDQVAQRAGARRENLAGELVELHRVGERQRQRVCLGHERVAERAGESVEPRVERVVAGEERVSMGIHLDGRGALERHAIAWSCHCEERSDEAIHRSAARRQAGLLRFARNGRFELDRRALLEEQPWVERERLAGDDLVIAAASGARG